MTTVNPDDPTQQRGGKPPRADSETIILRNLQKRVDDLEAALANVAATIPKNVVQNGVAGAGDLAISNISISAAGAITFTLASGVVWVKDAVSGALIRVPIVGQTYTIAPAVVLPASGQYVVIGLEIDTLAQPHIDVRGAYSATVINTGLLIASNSPNITSGRVRIADFSIFNNAGTFQFGNSSSVASQGVNWIDRRPRSSGAFYPKMPTSSPSTSSFTFTPLLPATDYSARIECSGAPMFIWFSGAFTHTASGGVLLLGMFVDGSQPFGAGIRLTGGTQDINNGLFEGNSEFIYQYTPPSSGSHLFTFEFATNTGTVQIPGPNWGIMEFIRQPANNGTA